MAKRTKAIALLRARKLLGRCLTMRNDRQSLEIDVGGFCLPASFWRPPSPIGVVLSLQAGRLDHTLPSDRHLLEELVARGFAVLAMGLFDAHEESSPELAQTRRFDIEELSARAVRAIDWVGAQGVTALVGVVARGTAAAAALVAASRRRLGAIVSITGRPDLAIEVLPRVEVPTLFLVGADHVPSLHFSQIGADRMYCSRELQVIPGGGLLESPSEAEAAAKLALDWFGRHLVGAKPMQPLVLGNTLRSEITGRWKCLIPERAEPREVSPRRDDIDEAALPTK